jgi:hypothetical protein
VRSSVTDVPHPAVGREVAIPHDNGSIMRRTIYYKLYRDSQTDKSFVRVDVTEEFPFLVTKLSPYIDRGQ